MRDQIIAHINQLEQKENIKILLAAESGSRAWGCPSPDSDYDVRIIFVRPKIDYLNIDMKPESIDYFHGELLDINGWDIKKMLRLIRKSNATPFEWAQSPIVYKEVDNFSNTIMDLSRKYFVAKHSINHYRGIAKNSYASNSLEGTIKLKKLFYVLRPIMAAKWIIEKTEIPPMDIPSLLSIIEDKTIVSKIKELLKIKESANEDYMHSIEPAINEYINSEFDIIDSAKIEDNSPSMDSKALNSAFHNLIL